MNNKAKRITNCDVCVQADAAHNCEVVLKIVFDMMKYLLFHRNQIPLHFDALQRELNITKEVNSFCGNTKDSGINKTENHIVDRKKEMKQHKYVKYKKRWVAKLEEYMEKFYSIQQILRSEIADGSVNSVNIVIGSSPRMAKEIYGIILPSEMFQHSIQSDMQSKDILQAQKNNQLKILRSFIANEHLSKHMGTTCIQNKTWIVVSKASTICKINFPHFTSIIDFSFPRNSKSMKLIIEPSNSNKVISNNCMDLTPCVGGHLSKLTCGSVSKLHRKPQKVKDQSNCDAVLMNGMELTPCVGGFLTNDSNESQFKVCNNIFQSRATDDIEKESVEYNLFGGKVTRLSEENDDNALYPNSCPLMITSKDTSHNVVSSRNGINKLSNFESIQDSSAQIYYQINFPLQKLKNYLILLAKYKCD